MNRRLFALGWLLTLVLVSAACGPKAEESSAIELTKVRFGVSPFQDTLLPIIGEEKGWYEDEGLDVEFVVLGWSEVQEALAAGEIDVAINNISSIIATHESWPEFVYYYGFNIFDAGAALMARPEFESVEELVAQGVDRQIAVRRAIAQLSGRTVITTSSTDMEQAVLGAAYRAGLDFMADVNVIDLGPDEGLAAFLGGTGDFYLGGIPQRTRATQEGMKAIVIGADLAPPPINGIVTTRQYLEKHENVLQGLVRVWFQIANFVEDDVDAGAEIVLSVLNTQTGAGMTTADFKVFWQNYEHYPLSPDQIQRDILDPDGYAYWRTRWDDCNWYFHEVRGTISAPVDPMGVFVMEEAQRILTDSESGSKREAA